MAEAASSSTPVDSAVRFFHYGSGLFDIVFFYH